MGDLDQSYDQSYDQLETVRNNGPKLAEMFVHFSGLANNQISSMKLYKKTLLEGNLDLTTDNADPEKQIKYLQLEGMTEYEDTMTQVRDLCITGQTTASNLDEKFELLKKVYDKFWEGGRMLQANKAKQVEVATKHNLPMNENGTPMSRVVLPKEQMLAVAQHEAANRQQLGIYDGPDKIEQKPCSAKGWNEQAAVADKLASELGWTLGQEQDGHNQKEPLTTVEVGALKLGFNRANWKDRWFVLEGSCLQYYTNKKAYTANAAPKGSCVLSSSSACKAVTEGHVKKANTHSNRQEGPLPAQPHMVEISNVIWGKQGQERTFYLSFDYKADAKKFLECVANNIMALQL